MFEEECRRCACDYEIRAGDGNVAGDPISGQAMGAEENTTLSLSLPTPHPKKGIAHRSLG